MARKSANTKRSRWDLAQRAVATGVSSECPKQNEPDSNPTGPSVATSHSLLPTPIGGGFVPSGLCHMLTLVKKLYLQNEPI